MNLRMIFGCSLSISLLTSGASGLGTTDVRNPSIPQVTLDEGVWEAMDGTIHADGKAFQSWSDFFRSPTFRKNNRRCASPVIELDGPPERRLVAGTAADCSLSFTNPAAEYGPTNGVFVIDVVVHNIASNNGTGFIDDAIIASQIDVLNEDFSALPGTLGAGGTDCAIEFRLATIDPSGNPTNGITHQFSNRWYNDRGNYKSQLAWDPNRYLNIYTNTAGGNLGYVEGFPQQGIVGSTSDGVVCNWTAFGRNSPGAPYDQGRTATHEVGHYLGLLHTFQGGCGTSNCSASGDLVCDTNPESAPNYSGCSRSSCGSSDPVRNYMDYSEDACMNNFTPDQAARMRCVLIHYRADLWSGGGGGGPEDPVGACCVGTSCSESTEADCLAANGEWLGENTDCGGTPCDNGGGGGDPVDATLVDGTITRGTLSGGDLGSLAASDDARVVMASSPSGNRNYTELEVTLNASVASVSDLTVSVETACTNNRARTAIEIFDLDANGWFRLQRYSESTSDRIRDYDGLTDPQRFVDPATGDVLIRIATEGRGQGFSTGVDLVAVTVTP